MEEQQAISDGGSDKGSVDGSGEEKSGEKTVAAGV